MATSIPLASFGANPAVATEIQSLLRPEYDIVHICLTLPAASTELPPLLTGNLATEAACPLGSNASLPVSERRVPRVVIFGGGIPDEQVGAVMEAVRAARAGKEEAEEEEVKVVRVTREDILATGAPGPSAGVIAGVIRGKLGEMGL